MIMRKKKDRPRLDTISAHKKHGTLSLKEKEHFTIQINKRKAKNFLKRNTFLGSIAGILILLLLIVGYAYRTRAGTATFYPSACLGGWSDSSNAERQPQVGEDGEFDSTNSASLNNRISQIYCGSFQGELPEDSDPKKIVLKFSWGVKKEVASSTEKGIDPKDDLSHSSLNIETASTTKDENSDDSSSTEEIAPAPGISAPVSEPEPATPPETPSETPATESQSPAATPPPPPSSDPVSFFDSLFAKARAQDAPSDNPDALFNVLYTLDGATWKTLGTVTQDEIGRKEFEIPSDDIYDQEDLSHIQINIQSQTTLDQDLTVYLDSMWLEVRYEKIDPDILENGTASSTEAFRDQKKTFRADETPEFRVNIDSIQSATSSLDEKQGEAATTTALQKSGAYLKKAFTFLFKKKALAQSVSAASGIEVSKINVLDSNGKDTNLKTDITSDSEATTIKIERPQTSIRPGKYSVRMKVETPDGPVITEDEFMWGVLAINTDKSVYRTGESVYLQIGSLDQAGHTLCDSNLTLKILDPTGNAQTFKTKSGGISKNDTCGVDNVTDEPDYSANFVTSVAGTYSMTLTNEDTGNEIDDSFYVQPKLTYNIQRIGATRINPFKSDYKMTLKVTANTAFKGDVNEYFPSTFAVSDISDGGEVNSASNDGAISKRISWNISIKKGESMVLTYVYQAPKESPSIFHLGQAEIISHASSTAPQKVFVEKRKWQLASDAACTFTTGTWDGVAGAGGGGTAVWSSCAGGGTTRPAVGDTITVNSGQTLTMTGNGTVSAITIANATVANGIIINNGATLTVSGTLTFTTETSAVAQTVTLGSSGLGAGNLTVGGITMNAPGGAVASISKIACFANSSSIGTLTVSGIGAVNITGSSVASNTGLASIDLSAGACNMVTGTSGVTLTAGSVTAALLKMGTGNLTLKGNLTFTGTAARTQFTTTSGGTITVATSSTPTVSAGGTVTIGATTALVVSAPLTWSNATTITSWGSCSFSNAGTSTFAGIETCASLSVNTGASLQFQGFAFTVSGTTNIAGTLACPSAATCTGLKTFTGAVTVASGGTFDLTDSSTNATTLFSAGVTQSSANLIKTGTGAAQIVGNIGGSGTGGITFGGTLAVNSGTTTNSYTGAVVTVTGTLTCTGVWVQGNGSLLTLGATTPVTTPANFSASTATNTVTFTNTATIPVPGNGGANYSNLTINAPALTVTSAAVTVNGTTTITAGTFSLANSAFIATGPTNISGALGNATGATVRTFNGLVTIKSGGSVALTTGTAPGLSFGAGITSESGAGSINFGTGATAFTATQSILGPVNITLGAVTVNSGVTLTNGSTATVTMASLAMAAAASGNTLSLSNNSNTTVTGAISFTANTQLNSQSILMNGDADLTTATLTVNTPTGAGSSLLTCVSHCTGTFHATGAVFLNGNDTSTGVVTMAMDTATTTIDGLLTIDGGATSATTVSADTGLIDLGAGITFSGTLGNAKLNTTAANTVELTGTWTGAGTLTGVNSGTILRTTGTVNLGGAITWPGKVSVFSGTTNLGAVAITFSGTVDVFGTLGNLSSATAKTFNGLVTIKSGGSVALTTTTNPALNFGAGITADSGAGSINWGAGATIFTATQALAGATGMTFGGTFTVNNSVTLTNNNTGTTTLNGAVTVTTTTGTIVNNGKVFASSTLADNGIVTNNSLFVVQGNLSGTGTWTQANGSTLELGGTTSSANTVTIFSASTAANTVNYYGAAQTVKDPTGGTAHTYYNLILSGSGAKTMTSITTVSNDFSLSGSCTASTVLTTVGENVDISGTAIWTNGATNTVTKDLTIGSGATLTMGNFALTISGSTSNTGTINTVTSSHNTTKTFTGLVTIQTGGAWDLSVGNPAIIFQGGLNRIGTGTFTSGSGSYTFSTSPQTLTGDNTFTITNASSSVTSSTGLTLSGANPTITNLTNITNAILTFSGTVPTITTLTATASGNTVQYTSTSPQTVKANTYYNLVKSGAGGVATLGGNTTVNNDLTIGSGTLDVDNSGNYSLDIKGDYTNSGIFTARTGTVSFSGTSQQVITGNATSTSGFYDLTFTNASGANSTDNERTNFVASVVFTGSAVSTHNFTITTPSVRVEYHTGDTYAFDNINWNGGTTTTRIFFRNSATSGTWNLKVSGVQTAVSSVNVSRSDASSGSLIDASDGTNFDANNNTNWNLVSLTCSTNISSTDFGALDISSVKTASLNATSTMTCGGLTGCSLYMHDQGSGASPGLYATTSTSLILSTSALLSAGSNGYGAQAATSSAGSGNTLIINPIYLVTGNNVGAFTIANSTVASSTGAITNREIVVTHKAAIAATTVSGSYADTITYSCTAN